jgi:hypothetical protein
MATLTVPNYSSITGPWNLNLTDCIGDSMDYINYNTNYFTCTLNALSSTVVNITKGTNGPTVFNTDIIVGPIGATDFNPNNPKTTYRLLFSNVANNTDSCYIYRTNTFPDVAELRVNVGDNQGPYVPLSANPQPADYFVVGNFVAVNGGNPDWQFNAGSYWQDWFRVGYNISTFRGAISANGGIFGPVNGGSVDNNVFGPSLGHTAATLQNLGARTAFGKDGAGMHWFGTADNANEGVNSGVQQGNHGLGYGFHSNVKTVDAHYWLLSGQNGMTLTIPNSATPLLNVTGELRSNNFYGSNQANVRLSFDSGSPIMRTNFKAATVVYLHPYRGNVVSLWSSQYDCWRDYAINSGISLSLASLQANTNYDLYVYWNGTSLALNPVAWSDSAAGGSAPVKSYKHGTALNPSDLSQRYVGCLRTVAAGQSEFSISGKADGGYGPKVYLWNAQNRLPISVASFDTGTWSVGQSTAWIRMNNGDATGGYNNRLSFICGDYTQVNMRANQHVQPWTNIWNGRWVAPYMALAVNNDCSDGGLHLADNCLTGEVIEGDGDSRTDLIQSFAGGYNFIQIVNLYVVSSAGAAIGLTDAGHGGQQHTGFVATIEA